MGVFEIAVAWAVVIALIVGGMWRLRKLAEAADAAAEPVEWRVFSEDHCDARYYEHVTADGAAAAAEAYARNWDRECGDGYSFDPHRVGVIEPGGAIRIFSVCTDDGQHYRATGGNYRDRTEAEKLEIF